MGIAIGSDIWAFRRFCATGAGDLVVLFFGRRVRVEDVVWDAWLFTGWETVLALPAHFDPNFFSTAFRLFPSVSTASSTCGFELPVFSAS